MPQEFRESDNEDDYGSEITWNNSLSIMAPYEVQSSESEDDESPEIISNTVTRATALDEIKRSADALKQQKNSLKEKRKRRNDLLTSQKQAKKKRFEELESKRLSDDVLIDVNETVEDENSKISTGKKSKQKHDSIIVIPSTSTQFQVKTLNKQSNSVVAKSSELQQIKEKLLRGRSKRETTEKALAMLGKQAANGADKFI